MKDKTDKLFRFADGTTFGEWLRERRKAKDYTLQDLEAISTLSNGNISRIENDNTMTTLPSGINLLTCLGIDRDMVIERLYQEADGKVYLPAVDQGSVPAAALTARDVQAFLKWHRSDPAGSHCLLADLLNTMIPRFDRDNPHDFDARDMKKILGLPSIFQFEIVYPPEIEPRKMEWLWKAGNVLMAEDIACYITWLYDNGTHPADVMKRLALGALERVRITDILRLDRELNKAGVVLSMYWDAYQFQEHAVPEHASRQQLKLVRTLLAMARWYQHLSWDDGEWLHKLRAAVAGD